MDAAQHHETAALVPVVVQEQPKGCPRGEDPGPGMRYANLLFKGRSKAD